MAKAGACRRPCSTPRLRSARSVVRVVPRRGPIAACRPGVSVGIMDSIPRLLEAVESYLDAGYLRIKLKIEPGWDVEAVRAVRERLGDGILLAGRREHGVHPGPTPGTWPASIRSTCC